MHDRRFGLYPNIPHCEDLISFRRLLEFRDKRQISSDKLIELAEKVLEKTLIIEFAKKNFIYGEPQSEQSLHLHMLFCL